MWSRNEAGLFRLAARTHRQIRRGDVEVPGTVRTLAELIAWLGARDEAYAATFSQAIVRAAIDRKHARPEASIVGAQEVAFFPPMTGG